MFDFIQTIFAKITSAVASVIIAVGLVSVPTPQLALPIQVEIMTEEKQNAQELEKIKLEAELEKAKAETAKAKAEATKAETAKRKIVEDNLRRQQEEQVRQLEQQRIQKELAQQREIEEARENLAKEETRIKGEIKIEVCKIEAQTSIKNFLEAGKLAADEGFQKCVQDRISAMQGYLSGDASPAVISSAYNLARSSCNNSAKEGLDFLQSKADEIYNKRYVECLIK